MSGNPFQNPVFACQADDGFLERIMAMYLDYAEAKARRHELVRLRSRWPNAWRKTAMRVSQQRDIQTLRKEDE